MGMGLLLFFILVTVPNSALHNLIRLCLYVPSDTLPLSPLYQEWMEKVQWEEALLVTPLSLLCGGLVLGRLAPRYASHKSVLLAGAAMAFSIVAASLAFTWSISVYETNGLNASEGGRITQLSAPLGYIVRQTLFAAAWTAVGVVGTALGLRLRDRRTPANASADTPANLRAVPH